MSLPAGIRMRKNGQYEYRKYICGRSQSFYSYDLQEIIDIKRKYENELGIKDINDLKNKNIKQFEINKENEKFQYVYFISDGEYCKIGVTYNLDKRLKQLQTGNPKELKIIHSIRTRHPYELENELHNIFRTKNTRYEWFDILDLIQSA